MSRVTGFVWLDRPIRLEIDPVDTPHIITVWSAFRVAFALDGVDQPPYTVAAGTPTDFASIPRPLQGWLVEKLGAHMCAAIVHDRMCIDQGPFDARTAAKIFHAAMLASRVPAETALAMYIAVRRFGPQWAAPA